ncbi:Cu/Ag efflux protein CusF [Aeromonas sp. BIGb0405]|jgi:Cu(I)/Ag(I) efflux system periplasmic protein CusF|uniref:copper-binding protein n=1 Tax=Aeromonas TaxID=642 RepID=UPI001CCE665D|nr:MULTISPECIES: copper-binding protein [Aeromonas]MCS3454523.1 Cu/Ag efflux protein CusF [Aeromonas sp. BIGb0405]UBO75252.1 copper-binding protein [Aeromonas rivuli]
MNYQTLTLTLLLGLATHTGLQAEEMMSHEGHDMSQMSDMQDMNEMTERVMTKGVISRIDAANHKVGIKHEAITNLKMPPMTMVFTLADPAQLQGLTVGDAVSFHAEQQGGKLILTRLRKQ